MPLVASVDYPNKRIYLSASTVDQTLDTLDVYREVRALRVTTEAHRAFLPIISAGGNIPKIPGVSYTPAYARLVAGCRIVPYDATGMIKLVRDTFTDDGVSGRDCFDRTGLTPGVVVDIDVDIQEVEIRTVAIGSAVTEQDKLDIAAATIAAAQANPIHADTKKMNGATVVGTGNSSDKWRGV